MIKLEISSFIQDEYPSCNVPKHIVNEVELGWLLGVGHLDYPLFHLQLKRSHCIEQIIALHSHTPSFDKLILRSVPRWEGFELLKMVIQWSKRNKGSKQWVHSLWTVSPSSIYASNIYRRDVNLFLYLLRCTTQFLQFVKVVILFQVQSGIIL
jgi:hypothetical protein